MKKLLIAFLGILAVFCPLIAQASSDNLAEAITFSLEKEKAKHNDKLAEEAIQNIVDVSFFVTTKYDPKHYVQKNDQYALAYILSEDGSSIQEGPLLVYKHSVKDTDKIPYEDREKIYQETKNILSVDAYHTGCVTFAIDKNWTIASKECIGTKSDEDLYPIVSRRPNGVLKTEGFEWYPKSFLEEENLASRRIFVSQNMILFNIAGFPITEKVKTKPVNGIIFFRDNIFSLFNDGFLDTGKFKIRTTRFNLATVVDRTLKQGSYDKGLFKLTPSPKFNAIGGDGIFFVKDGISYLAGFNAGKIEITPDGYDYAGKLSDQFYDLKEADYHFLKNTISSRDPAAWDRISKMVILH